eukprot:scaffold158792_cov22-Tisochrysis_lutea.AAC.1
MTGTYLQELPSFIPTAFIPKAFKPDIVLRVQCNCTSTLQCQKAMRKAFNEEGMFRVNVNVAKATGFQP